jgi:hypothetical protein
MDTIGTLELGLFLGLDWAAETVEFERTVAYRSDVVRVDGRLLASAAAAHGIGVPPAAADNRNDRNGARQ